MVPEIYFQNAIEHFDIFKVGYSKSKEKIKNWKRRKIHVNRSVNYAAGEL